MWLPAFEKPQSERSHTKLDAKISGSHVKFLKLPKKNEKIGTFHIQCWWQPAELNQTQLSFSQHHHH
jgi:hypothetical protein